MGVPFLFSAQIQDKELETGATYFQQLRRCESSKMASRVFNNIDFSTVSIGLKTNGGGKNLISEMTILKRDAENRVIADGVSLLKGEPTAI